VIKTKTLPKEERTYLDNMVEKAITELNPKVLNPLQARVWWKKRQGYDVSHYEHIYEPIRAYIAIRKPYKDKQPIGHS
jgi:hypothetical protein